VRYFFVGRPRPARSVEISDDFILRLEPRTGGVVGFTSLDLSKHFALRGLKAKMPSRGTFGPEIPLRSLASAYPAFFTKHERCALRAVRSRLGGSHVPLSLNQG